MPATHSSPAAGNFLRDVSPPRLLSPPFAAHHRSLDPLTRTNASPHHPRDTFRAFGRRTRCAATRSTPTRRTRAPASSRRRFAESSNPAARPPPPPTTIAPNPYSARRRSRPRPQPCPSPALSRPRVLSRAARPRPDHGRLLPRRSLVSPPIPSRSETTRSAISTSPPHASRRGHGRRHGRSTARSDSRASQERR